MIYGYCRVSTAGQDLAAQIDSLLASGAQELFQEKISGTWANRPQLLKLIKLLAPGDVVMVTRLDRLARSSRDLLNILDDISKAGASFRSLGDAWADTTTPHGRLILTVLGGLAEFEASLIKARTTEGRERAKAKGKRMGRPPMLTPHQDAEARAALANGSASPKELAARYNVGLTTIYRLKQRHDVTTS